MVPDDLEPARARELAALTGPDDPTMSVVQIDHLGGAPAKEQANAVPFRSARHLVRVLNPPDGTGMDAVRTLHARAFEVREPRMSGRSAHCAFGGGERRGLHEPETQKRLAGLRSLYDPASLFCG
ncbi:hypothetical protein ACIQ7Q_13570 [Streptomyces sp. NPDC096176]|uniref:hypothetical protein n=1 Tax=Streptomyces sp. NPDC096176 TaxID=3366079 RepID=UPI00380CD60F